MSRLSMTIAVVATLLCATAILFPTAKAQEQDCAAKLVPCYKDLNSTATPSTECCSSIKEAVETQLPCLCTIYTTPGLLQQFGVTVDQAMRLTHNCGINSDLSACQKIGGAPSPSAPVTPPGTPGGDKGAGNKIAWTGIPSLLMIYASMILY